MRGARWLTIGLTVSLLGLPKCATDERTGNVAELPPYQPIAVDESGPIELLDSLVAAATRVEKGDAACVVLQERRPSDDSFLTTEHIPILIGRLSSQRPCVSVATEGCRSLPGLSTEGQQAAYLIAGFRYGEYPPTIDSDHFEFDPENLKAWWRIVERDGIGCNEVQSNGGQPPSVEARMADELDIKESVLRFMFDVTSSHQRQEAPAYFVGAAGTFTDLPDSLMTRFIGHSPPVKSISELKTNEETERELPPGVSIPGLVFSVGEIEWITGDYAQVYGGYYEGVLSAAGYTYCVIREAGEWVVVGWKDGWVS